MPSETFLTEEQKHRLMSVEQPIGNVDIEKDHIRMFSTAIQDDNPLWSDEFAARTRRYGGLIAPPTFSRFIGFAARPKVRWQEGLPGTVSVDGGTEWDYFSPIRPGDRIAVHRKVTDVFERQGSAGPLLFVIMESSFINQFDQTVVIQRSTSIRYDAQAGGSRSGSIGKTGKTNDFLSEISIDKNSPDRRGDQLHWDDVAPGDDIPALVNITSTQDLVKYAAASRDFSEIHYDRDFAESIGLPGLILHGALKAAYLGRLVTDWIGELGDLKKLGCQHRGMDRPGEPTICKGKVKAKRVKGGEHLVDCDVWLQSSDGRQTAPGWATVALPLRSVKREPVV